jgi:ESF2/ABP1 family protein
MSNLEIYEKSLSEDVSREENSESEDEHDDQHSREEQGAGEDEHHQQKKKKVHKLSLAKTEDFNEKLRKRGVVYIARIPPRMTPSKAKALLSQFGTVTRIYLVEEDPTVRKRRKKNGGSGAKRYTEGWVEFEKKRVAKHVAQNLNTTPISNHKRNAHYGEYIRYVCVLRSFSRVL